MPVVLIETNLKDEDIPANFEIDLNKALAPVMEKDVSKFVTNLKTNQRVTLADSSATPSILFRCWSFSVFDNLQMRNKTNEFVYKYLKQCFPNFSYNQIKVLLHDMPAEDVGPKPHN